MFVYFFTPELSTLMDLGGTPGRGASENQVISVSEVSQRVHAALLLPCKCCRK